jgi:O-antigen ligase
MMVVFCISVFTGFVCSRALATIGMAGIVITSLIFKGLDTFRLYFKNKSLLILSLFFWIVFLSVIYSADKIMWLNWVRIKLPYLFLPLAFAPLVKLEQRKFVTLLYGFTLALVLSSAVVLTNYGLHYHQINEGFSKGNAVPMPYSHIRYTLMLTFAFFCSLYLWQQEYFLFNRREKWIQIFFAAFIFITLHILAVRSGLVALYLGLLYLVIAEILRTGKFFLGLLMLVLLTGTPFIAYQLLPGLHNKIGYMRFDLAQYNKGRINEFSDAMRVVSMKIGIDVWKENPVLGIGAGDLRAETDKIYERDYPAISVANRRLPHNQFIWVLATTGFSGFILFLFAFLYPFIQTRLYRWWLPSVLYLMLLSSFFTEDTLEEQIGTGFYIMFLLIFLNYYSRE